MSINIVHILYTLGRATVGLLTLVVLLGLAMFVGSHEITFITFAGAVVISGIFVVVLPYPSGKQTWILDVLIGACLVGIVASLMLAYRALDMPRGDDVIAFHIIHSVVFLLVACLGYFPLAGRR